jgi:hypothetical protein
VGAYFIRVGLEDADKVASVLGFFMGTIGLAISIYLGFSRRPTEGTRSSTAPDSPSPGTESRPQGEATNVVRDNEFHDQTSFMIGNGNSQTNHWKQRDE